MFLPLALVLLLILLWSIYWFVAAGIARDRLAAERATLAQQGWHLACTEEGWAGYPFHFEFSCRSPVLTFADKAEARSSNLLLVALAYAPSQIAVLLDGPTTISAPGLVPTKVVHERALAAITLDRLGRPAVSAEIPAAAVAGLGRADKLMVHSRPSPAAAGTDVAVIANGLVYEPPGQPVLAVDDGSLLGTVTPDQAFAIDRFDLRQGDLRTWGSGRLALDPERRPTGEVSIETNDSKALLELAAPHLGLSESKITSLRTMLGLLGNSAKAPVIAKDGALYVGPFQVAQLRPLY